MVGISKLGRAAEQLDPSSRLVSVRESEAKSIGNERMAVVAKQQKPYVNAVMRARLQVMSAAVAFILVGNKNE